MWNFVFEYSEPAVFQVVAWSFAFLLVGVLIGFQFRKAPPAKGVMLEEIERWNQAIAEFDATDKKTRMSLKGTYTHALAEHVAKETGLTPDDATFEALKLFREAYRQTQKGKTLGFLENRDFFTLPVPFQPPQRISMWPHEE